MKIAVIDYGAGNLKSVMKAMNFLGLDCFTASTPEKIKDSGAMILPGVGAFPDAVRALKTNDLFYFIKEEARNKPLLGICLGMQMLFEKGYEFEEIDGLGLIDGTVEKLVFEKGLKIPHMGWNSLTYTHFCPLFKGCNQGEYVYFVHSYGVRTDEKNITAYTEYGQKVTAAVANDHIWGTQFHPEKSGDVGLKMLRNFCEYVKKI